ncbi:hypothetical protein [Paenibacillus sp. sgz500958]|uniref:hypothetical protein n=1 Tax=Paenibacillus sp. sgz500958 TaxID=3242475 RepID=UPI0036D3CA8B
MLKLLKYDFRRNRDLFAVALVITVLLQAGIWISAEISDWNPAVHLVASVMTYAVVGLLLLIQCCRTYDFNFKAYHRMLLPVQQSYKVLSPLLLFLLLLLGLTALGGVHLGLYTLLGDHPLPANFWPVAVQMQLQLIWSACYILIYIMLAITVALSVRFKGREWIGIATFIAVDSGFSLFVRAVLGPDSDATGSVFQIEFSEMSVSSGGAVSFTREAYHLLPTLMEMGFAVLLIYIITLLVKRRVEA